MQQTLGPIGSLQASNPAGLARLAGWLALEGKLASLESADHSRPGGLEAWIIVNGSGGKEDGENAG